MISVGRFCDVLADTGVRFVAGAPYCRFTAVLDHLARHPRLAYSTAADEGGALAMAAGAQLAGTRSAVLLHMSGFGNLVSPLTALSLPYRIPVLVVMNMQAWSHARGCAPQHQVTARVVHDWLRTLEVGFVQFTDGGAPLPLLLAEAGNALAAGRPVFVLVGENAIDPGAGPSPAARPDVITPSDLVGELIIQVGDRPVLAATGYLSRVLLEAGDRPQNFYMQGSTGHVLSVAVGAGLQDLSRRLVVLDGDGAALMHLGALAVAGHAQLANLVHVMFDEGGGRPAPVTVDVAAAATACGYRSTIVVSARAELARALSRALTAPGPVLLAVRGAVTGTDAADRASQELPSVQVAVRFRQAWAAGRAR